MNEHCWKNHPNAVHIDRVFESTKANFDLWLSLDKTSKKYNLGINATKSPQLGLAEELCDAHNHEMFVRIMSDSYEICRSDWIAHYASEVVCGLVAYKDCAYMLDSEPDELGILAALGNNCAKLLLPAAIVFAQEKDLL